MRILREWVTNRIAAEMERPRRGCFVFAAMFEVQEIEFRIGPKSFDSARAVKRSPAPYSADASFAAMVRAGAGAIGRSAVRSEELD